MTNGWTAERRAKQSAAIRQWSPWQRSTGAVTAEGKAKVSRNAYKGGTRPFKRLINRVTKAFKNIEGMTVEDAESILSEIKRLSGQAYPLKKNGKN